LLSPRHPAYDDPKWHYACLLADRLKSLSEKQGCLLIDLRQSLGAELKTLKNPYYLDGSHIAKEAHFRKAALIRPELAKLDAKTK